MFRRTKRGAHELDLYLSRKHDQLLASILEPGSYKKTSSLVIVDGFAVQISEEQVISLNIALKGFFFSFSLTTNSTPHLLFFLSLGNIKKKQKTGECT